MRAQVLFIIGVFAAILVVVKSEDFEKTIKATKNLTVLLEIAQNEVDGVDAFTAGQSASYFDAVDENNATFNALTAHYKDYVDNAGFFCLIRKLDYRMTVSNTRKLMDKYNRRNVTGEITTKFAGGRDQLEKNLVEVQRLQTEASANDSPKNVKGKVDQAQKMLIKGHKGFYGKVDAHMERAIRDMNNAMVRRRGVQTKKGNRLIKCAL